MTDALLVKYLVGEADKEEITLVDAWINQQEDNRSYFNQFKLVWQESLELAPRLAIDENAAWNRFIKKAQNKTNRLPFYRRMGWWQAAALLLLVITGMITYIIIQQVRDNKPVQVLAENSAVTRSLPDGSTVVLNKHSSLEYPTAFSGKERKVRIQGEGFFKIAHNAQQPFIVDCPALEITVVGTQFNVKTTGSTTTVIVEAGRVRVSRNGKSLLLNPGEEVLVNNQNGSMEKVAHRDQLYKYYRNHIFICDATPLRQLVEKLNEAYDANIIIVNKDLANQPISTTFNDEPLDKILQVIAQTFNARIEKNENSILLK